MPVSMYVDKGASAVYVVFPERIVSTNVSELKDECFDYLDTLEESAMELEKAILDFDKTLMIDSLGLNLLVSIIEWAEQHYLKVEASIRHDIIYSTLESVWLTQKMTVHRTQTDAQ